MSIVKDWMTEAANEIWNDTGADEAGPWIREVIAKHCPFKPDVAYMPVPRCETCKRWLSGEAGKFGECDLFRNGLSGKTQVTPFNFGCVKWEGK